MLSVTSVLRIGPTEANASVALLKRALLSHFDTDDEFQALLVSNRYFSARVLLQDVGFKPDDVHRTKEDGLILVFDALHSNPDIIVGDASSFDSLTGAHRQAEALDQCGDLLRLCVGVSLGDQSPAQLRGQNHEEEYSRRVLWCLDRGYEYVEADLSKEGLASGHDERDKDGFARIVEAISGTMWSSAEMALTKKEALKKSYHEEKELIADTAEAEDPEQTPYVPPDPSLLGPDSTLMSQIDDSKHDVYAVREIQKFLMEEGSLESQPVAMNDKGGREKDKTANDLEGVIREAKRIREASMSGQLSDDERRQRATDAAMLMMGLMDQLDMDSKGEVDEESSDDATPDYVE